MPQILKALSAWHRMVPMTVSLMLILAPACGLVSIRCARVLATVFWVLVIAADLADLALDLKVF